MSDAMTQASQTGATSTDYDDVISRPLPPGVHPGDPSEYISQDFGTNYPVGVERARPAQPNTGKPPYGVDNSKAIPVFQRASHDGDVRIVVVNQTTNGGTAVAVNRQRGRQRVVLSVPSKLPDGVTVPLGVTFGFAEADVQTGGNASCGVINQGDPPIVIFTEAPIWLGLIGANATGACQVLTENNPPTALDA